MRWRNLLKIENLKSLTNLPRLLLCNDLVVKISQDLALCDDTPSRDQVPCCALSYCAALMLPMSFSSSFLYFVESHFFSRPPLRFLSFHVFQFLIVHDVMRHVIKFLEVLFIFVLCFATYGMYVLCFATYGMVRFFTSLKMFWMSHRREM